MSLTLRQIRYLVAVAEAGSITGAAQRINISQSVITEAIKDLEQELGARLLARRARGVVLTHAGHQFLRHARRILDAVREAEQALDSTSEAVHGHLNLGVSSMVAGYYLADLLARFRRSFANVTVHVTEDDRAYIEHLLVNGELDLAVVLVSNLENRQALEEIVLVRSPFRLWLPARHPLLARSEVSLDDIANQPLIMLGVDELEQSARAIWQARGAQPKVVLRTTSVEAVRSLVATGAGLAILPTMAFRPWSLEGDRLEARPLKEATATVDVGIVWRRGSVPSQIASAFIEIAQEQ